jgi:hypothetical protein
MLRADVAAREAEAAGLRETVSLLSEECADLRVRLALAQDAGVRMEVTPFPTLLRISVLTGYC